MRERVNQPRLRGGARNDGGDDGDRGASSRRGIDSHTLGTQDRRRHWLARLGHPVDLDFAFFAIGDVMRIGPTRTVAMGELGTGRIRAGDELEAVGYSTAPLPVRVERVERPDAFGGGVSRASEGVAGDVLGLTLEHDASAEIIVGQCIAPAGRLRATARIEAEVWIVSAEDLPCVPDEQRSMLDELAAGRGLELFFHTRTVAARVSREWRPELGEEYRLAFELAAPVPLYEGARFGLMHRGLTVGVGFVVD